MARFTSSAEAHVSLRGVGFLTDATIVTGLRRARLALGDALKPG